MTDRPNVVEQLLSRVRAGEEAARAELFEHLKPSLRRAADRQRQRHPGGKSTETLLAETIHEAERRFAEFQGNTQAELRAWLMEILAQITRAPAGGEDDPNATISPGSAAATTLAKTVSDSAVSSPPADADPHGTISGDSPAGRELAKAVSDSAAIPPTPTKTPPPQPDAADTLAVAGPDADATIAPKANATIAGATPKPAAPPAKTFGDYDILKTIAKGGMGVVYKARQRKLNRIVALKMILAGQFADQTDVDRFYTEAQAAGTLDHKNIVGIHEVGECDGQHFFSMQYVEGQGLDSMVRERPLAPRVAARYMRKVASAMQHAHELGILHRDLKPANILVDQRDEPLITDFGLAKRADDQSQVTMAGTIMGTASYMPPEQASGNLDAISAKSDVYSLGATLYELLTGKPPFGAASVWETIKQVKESEPISPRVLNPSVPADLETICLKCLQKEPARRYATAQELVEELERYLAGEPILARPVGPVDRLWRWCKRNPRVAISAGTVALTLLLATIFSTYQWRIAQTEREKAEKSIVQMRVAINDLYNIVANDDLLNQAGAKPLRKKLLKKAAELFEQALTQVDDNPFVQEDLGRSLFSYGGILRELGDLTEAEKKLVWSRDIQSKLWGKQPNDVTRLQDLGNTLNLLGQVLESQQRLDEALQVYQEAIPLRAELVKLKPQDYAFRRKWINSLMNQGLIHKAKFYQGALIHYELAQKILGESQDARDDLLREMAGEAEANLHLDSAMGSYNLLLLQDVTGLISDLEYEIELLEENSPLDEQQRLKLQQLKEDLASLEKSREGWQGRAQKHLIRAFDELDLLLADDAGKIPGYESLTRSRFQLQHLYAECLMQKGRLAKASGENQASLESYDLAREVLEALVKDNKNSPEYSDALARAYYFIAELQFDLYKDDAALKAIDKAIELWDALGSSHAQQRADAINFRGEITDAIEKASADSKATEDEGPEDPKAKETLPNDTNTSPAGASGSSAP